MSGSHATGAFVRLSLVFALLSATVLAPAQQSASVSVNVSSPLRAIPTTAYGVNTAVWDGNLLNPDVPSLLKQADVNILRFPGVSHSASPC